MYLRKPRSPPANAMWNKAACGLREKNMVPAMPRVAMKARPVARPSRPSMRLNALTAPTIQHTVRRQSNHAGSIGHSARNPSPAHHHARNATATWKASFSFGRSDHLSSTRPTRAIAAASAMWTFALRSERPCSRGRPVMAWKTI